MSWRNKSIEKFDLQPVPDGWKDSVTVGSEEAWKRYYEYRSHTESQQSSEIDFDSESSDDKICAGFSKEWKATVKEHIN